MKYYILHNAIKKEVAEGRVRASSYGDLTLYKYNEECSHNGFWNETNRLCRGIIFSADSTLIARPLPKFFNLNEEAESSIDNLPQCGFVVEDKLDGSCGIGYLSEGSWWLATPGSMVSEQASRGTAMLARYDIKRMPIDVTPIFEIIYPENRIVVDYCGEEKLVLLAIMEYNGQEWHWSRVDQMAETCGFERPQRFSHDNLAALPHRENSEGYVIRFENNFRVKVKSPWYVAVHRLLNYMTPKNVIELIRGREYRAILEKLPPDLQASMDDIRAAVQTAWLNHRAVITGIFNAAPRGDRKTFALWVKAHAPIKYLGALFGLLDQREIEDLLWKIVLEEIKGE